MSSFLTHFCTICGREKNKATWFLITENRWEDKVKVLSWNSNVAQMHGVEAVCGPDHALALVVHWMRSGSLNYPFSKAELVRAWGSRRIVRALQPDADVSEARELCELYVHRESVGRIMFEDPGSLETVLEELVCALSPKVRPPGSVEHINPLRELYPFGD
jgi:hypothetical protein